MVIPPTGAIIAGSSQNLTCNVEMSPVVDVLVTVSTVWTGPAGFTTTNIILHNLLWEVLPTTLIQF